MVYLMIFYLNNPLQQVAVHDEVNHLISARVQPGEIIQITDLKGLVVRCVVEKIDKKTRRIEFNILEKKTFKKPIENILIQAKTDKLYIEKLCEIAPIAGITTIFLVETDFSLKNQQLRLERLEHIMIRSCEQCHYPFLPHISIINTHQKETLLNEYQPVVLDGDGVKWQDIENDERINFSKKAFAIGPEGGWSEAEKKFFKEQKLPFISIGEHVLPAWLAGYTWSEIKNNSR